MYTTEEDVRGELRADLLPKLIQGEAGASPEEAREKISRMIQRAIGDAQDEIDGYLAKRYPVPLTKPPGVVRKYAKDIAVYNLISRIGVGGDSDRENNYLKRYQAAIHFLELIVKGQVDIGLTPPAKAAASGFQLSGPSRIFSRESLKGM